MVALDRFGVRGHTPLMPNNTVWTIAGVLLIIALFIYILSRAA